MAAIEKLKIPNKVIKAKWEDDVDVDYATYGDEKQEIEYISPDKVSKESIKRLKERKIGHTVFSIFTQKDKIAA